MKKEEVWLKTQAQYTEIVIAIGVAKTEGYYLSNKHIAEAIATGIMDDLPYLIKELEKIKVGKIK